MAHHIKVGVLVGVLLATGATASFAQGSNEPLTAQMKLDGPTGAADLSRAQMSPVQRVVADIGHFFAGNSGSTHTKVADKN
jgi:hypothetical protein